MIKDYFSKLFTATSGNGKLTEREVIQQFSEQDNMDLIAEIDEVEVKKLFFLCIWTSLQVRIVKTMRSFNHLDCGEEICRWFLSEIYSIGYLSEYANQSLIFLIPKVKIP